MNKNGKILNARLNEISREVTDFVPVLFELEGLVKFWAEEGFRMCRYMETGFIGNWENCFIGFANNRINRIEEILGENVVNKLIDELKAELIREGNDWDIYFNGTKEQKKALLEEYQRDREKRT